MATTQVFGQVIDVTGRKNYYALPENFQAQYRDLDARALQIYKEKSSYLSLWVLAYLFSGGMATTGFILTLLHKDKRLSLPLLIIGLLGMGVSLRCIRRYSYNEAGQKLDALVDKMRQKIIAVHSNYQAEHRKHGITRISREPPADSTLITISWKHEPSFSWEHVPPPVTLERAHSPEATELSVLLEAPEHEAKLPAHS